MEFEPTVDEDKYQEGSTQYEKIRLLRDVQTEKLFGGRRSSNSVDDILRYLHRDIKERKRKQGDDNQVNLFPPAVM